MMMIIMIIVIMMIIIIIFIPDTKIHTGLKNKKHTRIRKVTGTI